MNTLHPKWTLARISEVAEILDSQRIPINADERRVRVHGKAIESLFPYYGATGSVGVIDGYLFEGEHILLGEDGAPFLDPFACKAYLAKGKFWVNNHAHILKAAVSNRYLMHFLNFMDYSGCVTGTTRLKLTQAALREICLPFAPAKEQERIVAKIEELFSELDKGVESLTTTREQLKAYRQSVLNRAVVGELAGSRCFPSKPLSAVVEELGQGWSPRCLNHPAADDETWAVITTTAIQHSVFQEQENKQLPEELEPRPHLAIGAGDILITRAGPRKRVGVACLVRQCRPRLMLCDKAYRLRADTGQVFPEWLELVLNSPSILQKIEELKTGISDSGVNLTQTRFLELEVPVPSLVEQTAVLARVDSLTSQMTNLEAQIQIAMQRSEALRQSILRRAFSGQLVAQDPADEPASALLERIRAGGVQVKIRARKRGGARA